MPIVINLGQEITATKIKDTAKEIVVAEHRHYNGKKDILTDTDKLNEIFSRLVQDMPEMIKTIRGLFEENGGYSAWLRGQLHL